MTTLSPQAVIIAQKVTKILIHLDRLLFQFKRFLFQKCPQLVQDILTFLTVLKDITSFIPSVVYKTLLFISVFSIVHRKVKKYFNKLELKQQSNISENSSVMPPLQGFNELGSEYQVKSIDNNKKVDQNAEIDSCCLDMDPIVPHFEKDFRDIVFFQLLKSYKDGKSEQQVFLTA